MGCLTIGEKTDSKKHPFGIVALQATEMCGRTHPARRAGLWDDALSGLKRMLSLSINSTIELKLQLCFSTQTILITLNMNELSITIVTKTGNEDGKWSETE